MAELQWVDHASTAEMEQCYAVRLEVFVQEQSVPLELEIDEADITAKHALALIDGEPAGTARLLIDTLGPGQAKIGRVAVRTKFRGQGLASKLMALLEMKAKDLGQSQITLDAQVSVIPLYEKLGYEAYGPIFDDAGIDHRKMTKTLST